MRGMKAVGILAACAVLIVVGALVCLPHLWYQGLESPDVAAVDPFATPTPPPLIPSTDEAIAHGVHGIDNTVFWRALNNFSTGSSLVLVQVIDATTQERHTVCVDRRALIDAIVIEHDLGLLPEWKSDARAIALALAQPDRTFVFSKAKALALVSRAYSETTLALVHKALDPLSDREIITGFSRRGHLDHLYDRTIHPDGPARYFAIGHVLIERHLVPSRDCFIGALYVQK
jgi:hypothetical protein